MDIRSRWDNLTSRSKIFFMVGFGCVVFGIPVLIALVYNYYMATINLTFAPKSAQVKIGNSNGMFGKNFVIPGTYEITISKQGFVPYRRTVTVKSGDKIDVEAALESNDSSTSDWYQKNIDDYSIAQGIGDRQADKDYKKMMDTFPIVNVLPIVGLYSTYRIDYGLSPTMEGKYAIFISYISDQYKADAVSALEKTGYQLSDYEIIYTKDEPEKDGGVVVIGFESLLSRGVSAVSVGIIQDTITSHYATFNGEKISTIHLLDGVVHARSDDGLSDIYSGTLRLNDRYDQSMQITTTPNTMAIVVGSVTVYSGSREMR